MKVPNQLQYRSLGLRIQPLHHVNQRFELIEVQLGTTREARLTCCDFSSDSCGQFLSSIVHQLGSLAMQCQTLNLYDDLLLFRTDL